MVLEVLVIVVDLVLVRCSSIEGLVLVLLFVYQVLRQGSLPRRLSLPQADAVVHDH